MNVTDEDREKAASVLGRVLNSNDHLIGQAIIAAALAEERERARAPFLALAEELVREAKRLAGSTEPEHSLAYSSIAERIRRAAEESA